MEMFNEDGMLILKKDSFKAEPISSNRLGTGWSYRKGNTTYCRTCLRPANNKPIECDSAEHIACYANHLEYCKKNRQEKKCILKHPHSGNHVWGEK